MFEQLFLQCFTVGIVDTPAACTGIFAVDFLQRFVVFVIERTSQYCQLTDAVFSVQRMPQKYHLSCVKGVDFLIRNQEISQMQVLLYDPFAVMFCQPFAQPQH